MSTPPPIPVAATATPSATIYHKAGKYVIWILVLCLGLSFVAQGVFSAAGSDLGTVRRVFWVLWGVMFCTTVPAGVVALCGIPKHGRKGLLFQGLLGLLLPIVLTAMALPAFYKVRSNALEARARQHAQQFAAEINTGVPKMIDEVTRLDGAKVGPEKTVTMSITLIGFSKAAIDPKLWQEEVVAGVKNNVETTGLAGLVKSGVTLVYRYVDQEGAVVDELVFRPEDFQDKK